MLRRSLFGLKICFESTLSSPLLDFIHNHALANDLGLDKNAPGLMLS